MHVTSTRRRHPLALAIALAFTAGSSHAATITVTDGGDSGDSGTCTLRQAMVSMNSQSLQGGCGKNGDNFSINDTVVFGTAVPSNSTITLTMGQLTVNFRTAALTIQGSGQTIDANHASRVMYVHGSEVTLSSLTLSNGSVTTTGGGIYGKNTSLTLDHVSVSNNTATYRAGGIHLYNPITGALTLNQSTVSNNALSVSHGTGGDAGGIHAIGAGAQLTLNQSSVSNNTVSTSYNGGNEAGGIGVSGASATLTLNQSSVSNNRLSVYNNSTGHEAGGILVSMAALTLNQSTVSGNTLSVNHSSGYYPFIGAAGIHIERVSGSAVSIVDSTISGNSVNGDNNAYLAGGIYIYNSSGINITNSTLAGNSIPCIATCAGALQIGASPVTAVLTNSTVSVNLATVSGTTYGSGGTGGVLSAFGGILTLNNTILSGNSNNGSSDDLDLYYGSATAASSLLGSALSGTSLGSNNLYYDDPGLSGLGSNGGPTQTMALTVDSHALNNGSAGLATDPATANPLLFDQRGPGFPRMLPDGSVDIGAYQHPGTDRIFSDPFESGP